MAQRNIRPSFEGVGYETTAPNLAENPSDPVGYAESAKTAPVGFQKGISPNPGGRPKDFYKTAARARLHVPEALATVVNIMRNSKNEKLRLMAAESVMNRALGKPGIAENPKEDGQELTGEELSDMALEALLSEDGLDS